MGQKEQNICYCVVRVFFCVIVLLGCGYSIVRQQILEERLQVLEKRQLVLERLTQPSVQKTQVYRSRRDVADCVCPAARSQAYKSAFIEFNTPRLLGRAKGSMLTSAGY
ncbi:unnamed protein product [Leptosia nina]|uniref:Uncharacterized protein n=1 Tax=Leptosia nina TaxID=320188 RepID=A0AAV1IVQ7_9NEOP